MGKMERYLINNTYSKHRLNKDILLRPIPTPVLSGSGSKGPSNDVSGFRLPLGKITPRLIDSNHQVRRESAILLKWLTNSTIFFR